MLSERDYMKKTPLRSKRTKTRWTGFSTLLTPQGLIVVLLLALAVFIILTYPFR